MRSLQIFMVTPPPTKKVGGNKEQEKGKEAEKEEKELSSLPEMSFLFLTMDCFFSFFRY